MKMSVCLDWIRRGLGLKLSFVLSMSMECFLTCDAIQVSTFIRDASHLLSSLISINTSRGPLWGSTDLLHLTLLVQIHNLAIVCYRETFELRRANLLDFENR